MGERTMKKAIKCDLDGTLALLKTRSPFDPSKLAEDTLNHPVANILEVYSHQTLYPIALILLSGREERFRKGTEAWLKRHDITTYEALYLRKNKDIRKDYVIKKELYEREIKGKYEILFVLEDRDQVVRMWRDEGLTCLQVAYGAF